MIDYNLVEQEQKENEKFIFGDTLEYASHSVVKRTIIKRNTGNITVYSLDAGEMLSEHVRRFDTCIQIIDGQAEVVINDKLHVLDTGESIIIPAHLRNSIKAKVRFKMIATIIKSGYEDMT